MDHQRRGFFCERKKSDKFSDKLKIKQSLPVVYRLQSKQDKNPNPEVRATSWTNMSLVHTLIFDIILYLF